jgi:mono/diheme cytochrome c family protein
MPGGKPLSGGRPLTTPFGTIYTTNITPDRDTGIGTWTQAAFIRAMREGVDRNGRHLYPAFPYDYFARATDDDLAAIYAFLMTRTPVRQEATPNELGFPFNVRPLLAAWNAMYVNSEPFKPIADKGAEWNRGAYLVESLGHCGACHSPRNRLGAAAKSGPDAYSGGTADGWFVPALIPTKAVTPMAWTQKALVDYLIDGWSESHGIAAGPMTAIVDDLRDQSEDDVFAIAAYLMTLGGDDKKNGEQDTRSAQARAVAAKLEWGHPESPPRPTDNIQQLGARVFEAQCSTCHKSGGSPTALALTTPVNAPEPGNLIRVALNGIKPPRGSLARAMPARRDQITDQEMVALATFVRARFSTRAVWSNVAETVSSIRRELP